MLTYDNRENGNSIMISTMKIADMIVQIRIMIDYVLRMVIIMVSY